MTKKNNKKSKSAGKKTARVQTPRKQRKGKPQAFNLELGGSYKQTLTSAEASGRAKMSVSSTSIPAATTETLRPFFTVGKGSLKDSMRVQGLEVLHDGAFDPNTYPGGPVPANTVHKVFPMNPVTIASSRLRDLSLLYTKYVFRSVRIHWVPRASLVNVHNAGEIMLSFERDADAALAPGSTINYEDMFAREGSVASAVYSGFTATYRPNDPQMTYYVSGQVSSADQRLEQQAYLYFITGTLFQESTSDGDGYGRLYVEYDVEFFAPRTDSVTSGIYWARTDTSVGSSVTLPFGLAPLNAPSPYAHMVYDSTEGLNLLKITGGTSGLLQIRAVFASPVTASAGQYGNHLVVTAQSGSPTIEFILSGTVEQPESETEPVEYGAFWCAWVIPAGDCVLSIQGNVTGGTPGGTWSGVSSTAFFIPDAMLGSAVTFAQTSLGRLRTLRSYRSLDAPRKPVARLASSSAFDDAELVDDASDPLRDLRKALEALAVRVK